MSEENTPPQDGTGAEGETEAQRAELPTWNRGKSKRKSKVEAAVQAEVAEGDVFTRGVAGAGRAAASQGKLLGVAIVLGLGLIGGVVYWQQSASKASAESTRALSELVAIPSRGREGPAEAKEAKNPPPNPIYTDEADRQAQLDAALAAAKGVDDDEVRSLASLVEAAELFRAGDHDAALTIYEAFLASQPSDHPMAFAAKEGRALVHEAQGDLEGALAMFEAMTAQDQAEQFYADMALWHQGRLLERLERPGDAVGVYKRYLELYPEQSRPSLAIDKVKSRLAELDVPAVDPPSLDDAPSADDAPETGAP